MNQPTVTYGASHRVACDFAKGHVSGAYTSCQFALYRLPYAWLLNLYAPVAKYSAKAICHKKSAKRRQPTLSSLAVCGQAAPVLGRLGGWRFSSSPWTASISFNMGLDTENLPRD